MTSKESPWHICTKRIGEKTLYRVYRNLDEEACDTESNREYRGGLYDRLYDAETLAVRLNVEEAIKNEQQRNQTNPYREEKKSEES